MQIKRAFELLDEYNNPQTSETRIEQVVSQLYNAGYVIRPLKMYIIKNEVEAEVLNTNSSAWGLVSKITGRPIERDKQSKTPEEKQAIKDAIERLADGLMKRS